MEKPTQHKKGLFSLIVGVVLILVAGLGVLAAICAVVPKGFVDFPCFDLEEGGCLMGYGPVEPGYDLGELGQARMFLCISVYPRGWQGGGTIAQGPEFSDAWSGSGISLERQGDTLIVNGDSLSPGALTSRLRVYPTLNPWLLETARITIHNRGVFDCYQILDEDLVETQNIDALYVYGSVGEGWLPNPLGLVIVGIGIWLLVRGIVKRRRG
ncbi:MAG: hypothetical protein JW918_01745 [Anaerolineae bacterium]|nr:hypothetical protein [Anaerolineae bacterium]